jgi:energy-coupling factor transporter ATP-binding protein EcfA2
MEKQLIHWPRESPKMEIAGDSSVINALEELIGRFDSDRFAVIEGPSGSGKTELISYLSAVAYSQGQSVVSFDLHSPFVNGSVLHFSEQANQIRENPDKRYLVLEEDFVQIDLSDAGLAKEFFSFIDDASVKNYHLIATASEIESQVKDRAKVFKWEGAKSPEQKAQLMKYKLKHDICEISEEEFGRLGQQAYNANLSGRAITDICRQVVSKCLGSIYKRPELLNPDVKIEFSQNVSYETMEKAMADSIKEQAFFTF